MSDVPPKQTVTGTESVRINNVGGLPPMQDPIPDPVPVTPSAPRSEVNASSALVTMHDAASQAGSDAFPVLKAFQDYLESERQRSRRRIMTLSLVFSVVIVIVIGGFMLMWFTTVKGMQNTNSQLLQAALANAQAKQSEPAPQPVVIQAPAPAAPSAEETAKVIADAVAKAQSEQANAFAKTIENLNAAITAAQKENAEIKAEQARQKQAAEEKAKAEAAAAAKAAAAKAAAAKAAAEKAAEAKKAAMANSEPKPAAVQPPKAAQQPPKPQELQIPKFNTPPPPEGYSADTMAIRTSREKTPVAWRVYVPEHN